MAYNHPDVVCRAITAKERHDFDRRLMRYQTSLSLVTKLYYGKEITEEEWHRAEAELAKKNGFPENSIYRSLHPGDV